MTKFRVLTWRDIPLQVKARGEGRTVGLSLDVWFTEHVDRVAMAEGLYGTAAYLQQLSWSGWRDRPGAPEAVAAAVVAELHATWEDARQRWFASGDISS